MLLPIVCCIYSASVVGLIFSHNSTRLKYDKCINWIHSPNSQGSIDLPIFLFKSETTTTSRKRSVKVQRQTGKYECHC